VIDAAGRARVRLAAPGPGSRAGPGRESERAPIVIARIALVATIVLGQLWGLTVALNAYFQERMATVWWLVGFEALSFALALAVWLLARSDR
jgi:hypothetical protein